MSYDDKILGDFSRIFPSALAMKIGLHFVTKCIELTSKFRTVQCSINALREYEEEEEKWPSVLLLNNRCFAFP